MLCEVCPKPSHVLTGHFVTIVEGLAFGAVLGTDACDGIEHFGQRCEVCGKRLCLEVLLSGENIENGQ